MIYVSSACIKEKQINIVIRKLAESGVRYIELSGGTQHYDMLEEDIVNLQREYNLHYACHAYFPPPSKDFVVNLASCNDVTYNQSVQHYEKCIDMLRRIGCKVLSVHAGFMVEVGVEQIGKRIDSGIVYDKEKSYERFCCAYETLNSKCKKYGIDLFLENNVLSKENYKSFENQNYFMMTDYESIAEMKSRLDFNLLLDLGHLYVSSHTLGLDFVKQCEVLHEYTKWVHISENEGIIDEHKPLKQDSMIVKQFGQFFTGVENITLETVGGIDDVRYSYSMVEELKKIVKFENTNKI